MIKDFKDLIVWQKAMELVAKIYSLVKKLPKEELYALSDQMRRSAISIPSNIAEGQGRNPLNAETREKYSCASKIVLKAKPKQVQQNFREKSRTV